MLAYFQDAPKHLDAGPGIMPLLIGLAGLACMLLFAAGLGFAGWLVMRILIRNAYPPAPVAPPLVLRKCPHCGKDLP